MKYPKEKFKNINEAMERKTFNLTDPSGSNSSGEREMIAQLKENFNAGLGPEILTAKVLDQHDKSIDSCNTDSS
jgi:hypothetical protein